MAKVVEADAANSGPVEQSGEVAGEHVAAVLPGCPFRIAFPTLPGAVLFQGAQARRRQRDASFGALGLGWECGQATGVGALECAADAGGSTGQVEVFPAEAEESALAEAGAQGEFVQGVEPVGAGRVEELAGFGCGEWMEAPGPGRGGRGVPGDVAGQFVFADGVFQRRLEHRVRVERGRGDGRFWRHAPMAQHASRSVSRPWVQHWQIVGRRSRRGGRLWRRGAPSRTGRTPTTS